MSSRVRRLGRLISNHDSNRIIIILTLSRPGRVYWPWARPDSWGRRPRWDRTQVRIFDTTLRDGEQAPGFSLRPAEKLQLARQLDALGVDIIEAGFPIASPADAEAVRTHRHRDPPPGHRVPGALPSRRSREGGVGHRAGGAGAHPHVHRHLRPAPAGQAAHDARAVPRGGGRGGALRAPAHRSTCEFSAEDATRSDFDFLCRVVEAVIKVGRHHDQPARHGRLLDAGRDARLLPDASASACRTPTRSIFSAHCHDDLGLAVANSLAAVQGGARQVECTINGIGERAGNAALEEIVMAFRVRAGPAAVHDQHRHRRRSTRRARCSRGSPGRACR